MLYGLCMLSVCALGAEKPVNLFRTLRSEDVASVEFYEFVEPDTDPFADQAGAKPGKGKWKTTGVVVKDRDVIAEMHKALSRVELSSDCPYPAVGLLGHQFFFDKQGRLLAVTTIVNHRATVLVAPVLWVVVNDRLDHRDRRGIEGGFNPSDLANHHGNFRDRRNRCIETP